MASEFGFHQCHNMVSCKFEFYTELTHGWWSITNPGLIDRLLRTLCIRGFREKGLYKALQKNKDLITGSINPTNLNDCERLFKELLFAHKNNKLLPSVTSSSSSSSSSSNSSSDDESSGEGVKSEESEEAEEETNGDKIDISDRGEGVKSEIKATTGELMDTMPADGDKKLNEAVTKPSNSSSDEEKPSTSAPSNQQRTTDTSGGSDSTTGVTAKQVCEVPASGIYDPTYPSMTLHVAFKVMEYLEALQQRLITASLAVEVGVAVNFVLHIVHVYYNYTALKPHPLTVHPFLISMCFFCCLM